MTRMKADEKGVMSAKHLVLSTRYSVLSLIAISLISIVPTRADEPSADDAVQTAKDVLSRGGRFPWYDRGKDDVRRLNMTPRDVANERDVTWTGSTTTPVTKSSAWPRL